MLLKGLLGCLVLRICVDILRTAWVGFTLLGRFGWLVSGGGWSGRVTLGGLRMNFACRLIITVTASILVAAVASWILIVLGVCLCQNVGRNCLLRFIEEVSSWRALGWVGSTLTRRLSLVSRVGSQNRLLCPRISVVFIPEVVIRPLFWDG